MSINAYVGTTIYGISVRKNPEGLELESLGSWREKELLEDDTDGVEEESEISESLLLSACFESLQ
jgi:hypothetical protein